MAVLFSVILSLAASAAIPEAKIEAVKSEKAVQLQVSAPPGTHLNFDGPWKLEVKGALPLANATGVYGIDAFDKTKNSFNLPLTHKVAAGESGEYNLTYYFCAADNSWCRRAQAKGVL